MRSTVLLLCTAMLSAVTLPVSAQDGERTITRVFTPLLQGMLDPDRAVIGLTLGSDGGASDTLGVRVDAVTPDGPAEKAGITEGSIITAINGVSLRLSPQDARAEDMRGVAGRRLTREMAKADAGDEVELQVMNGGQSRTVRVTTVPSNELVRSRSELVRAFAADDNRASLGLSVRATGTSRDTLGAFVISVVAGGPAERAGIIEGQRIAGVNGVDLRVAPADIDDRIVSQAKASRLSRELAKLEVGDEAELRVYANGQFRTVRVRSERMSDVYEGQDRWMSILDGVGFPSRVHIAPSVAPAPPTPPVPSRARIIRDRVI